MLNQDENTNRHNLLFARHVPNEYGGWIKIVIQFRLSPWPQAGG